MANNVNYSINSPNYTPQNQVGATFGYPRSISWITIHWWGDPNTNPTYEGVVAWLCNPRSQVSAHDVITGTGSRVAVLVNYTDAAWHAGNSLGNATSLGFECDPRCRPEDYEAVAQDVAETWRYYGREIPLRGHSSWRATACPGNYDLNRIAQRAREINNPPKPAPAPTPPPVPTPEPTPVPVQPEWVRNLKDINDIKLSVLPAGGTRVINLNTLAPINDVLIPKGTQVDIAKETVVGGKKFYISNYSANANIANGILAEELGVPVVTPPVEKPEWLQNLEDIADKDMWTRSQTPVLDVSNGNVVDSLPINTKVRITHATTVVGKDLLMLEGGKNVIETLYLSDTELTNPNDDLEKRVSALEKLVETVLQFLEGIFKSFRR